MGIGFNGPPIIHWNGDNLHRAKRARHHTGFAANTFLLIHLHAVAYLRDGFIRATAGARRIFTMAACHGIAPSFMLYHRNARLKLLAGQNMLFFIVGHHAGHFTSMTPDTLLSIGKNKTIHFTPLPVITNRRLIFYGDML
ncbi:hypothetical protein D3C75_989480 [compost metagenome]